MFSYLKTIRFSPYLSISMEVCSIVNSRIFLCQALAFFCHVLAFLPHFKVPKMTNKTILLYRKIVRKIVQETTIRGHHELSCSFNFETVFSALFNQYFLLQSSSTFTPSQINTLFGPEAKKNFRNFY